MNLAGADRMLNVCERAATQRQIDQIYRFDPSFRQVTAMVKAGAIGELLEISGKCMGPSRGPEGYAGQHGLNRDGWLLAQGTHSFGLFCFHPGDPVWCLPHVGRGQR